MTAVRTPGFGSPFAALEDGPGFYCKKAYEIGEEVVSDVRNAGTTSV